MQRGGVTDKDVTATEEDNTPALEILISTNAVTVAEGGTATFDVRLNTAPINSTTVTVSWVSGDPDLSVQSGQLLVFDGSNWNTNQPVTLAAANDADGANGSATIRCSAPETADQDVTATEEDNTPALAILTSTNAVTVPEGGTATFDVRLNTAPISPTTVTVSWVSGDLDLSVQSGQLLVFDGSNWNTNQPVTLAAANDADGANGSATIRCSAAGLTDKDVTATEEDNTPGLQILTSTNAVTVAEGGTATFDVRLNTAPISPTTVTVSWVSGDPDLSVQSGQSLVFDGSNWNTNQTVTLAAANDADQLNGSATIRCSASGLTDKDVTATEEDNTPGLQILTSTNAVTVAEGSTATFDVRLNTAPISPTTVTVSWVSGDTDLSVQSGQSLVFDGSNWNTNQTVTLAAANDADQSNGSATIRCSAAGVTDKDVTATEEDNTPALEILISTNVVTVPEGGTATFDVQLNTAPISPTTVTVSWVSGDTDLSVQSGQSLVFDGSNWNTNQPVTLAAANDADGANGSATIRCSAAGVTDKDVTATEEDNTPALEILTSTNAVTVAEGSTATFDVRLNTAPISPTTVTVSWVSGDTDLSVQSGQSLVFDGSNWNTNQTVTLAAANDADQSNGSATIRCSASGITDKDVTATEEDNTPALEILISTNAVTVPEGGTATFDVQLNTAPISPTTVTVSWVSGDTDLSVQSGQSLVFDASNWNTNQTVTLAAANDADGANGSATIRCSAPGISDKDVTATEADNTPALEILISTNVVTVPEGSTATFDVRLNTAPINSTTVTVSWVGGDPDLSVQSGQSLVFDASNWNTNQPVTLAAANDADQMNGSATIRCSAPGITDKDVMATEEDNDFINLALASRGSTITGNNGTNWSALIDGVITGYTATTGFGYTYWKNTTNAPGSMTLDLKGLCTISSMRLLLWDLDSRYYQYKIEASSNNTTWTTIVVRTNGMWQSWQDIAFSPSITARYLRLIGTFDSDDGGTNNGFHAVEWQVFGTPPTPAILTSADAVIVSEGGTATFQVRLNTVVAGLTTVTVSRLSGNTNITVQSGGSLVFNASNWETYQTVTLSAAEDLRTVNSSAVIRCSAPGITNKDVMATEQINLALASRGSTITGNNGTNWSALIDGVTTGYTATTGFGYTYWKNTTNAPGSMTLDLKGLCTISSMRLLLWDMDSRYYQYKIEASSNSTTWTTIVVRTNGMWQSWQDIAFSPSITARYLRLIGTFDSDDGGTNNGFHAVEWQVFGTPPTPAILTSADAVIVSEGGTATFQVRLNTVMAGLTTVTVSRFSGNTNIAVQSGGSLVFDAGNWETYQTVTLSAAEDLRTVNSSAVIRCSAPGITNKDVMATEQINLALASRGSTITGNNGTNWSALIDGVITGYTATTGFGYTYWKNTTNAPGSMTLDLKGLCTISSMRLLLWDMDSRYYQYKIEASSNSTTWTTIVVRTNGMWQSWQDIAFSPSITARYLRLIGTFDSDDGGTNNGFHAVEWQVFGTPPTPAILTSADAVIVSEGGTATFQVRLNTVMAGLTTVTVSRLSGNTNITVQSGGSLVFNASNWETYQTVTLSAAEDLRTVNSSAVIRCSAPGITNKDVMATEQINLALASRGSTITGNNGTNWSALIDGVTTGYTATTGFGYTYWKNTTNAPGSMTLDLKGLCTISSMRLLLWDLDSRYYQYKIEASSNNTTWTTIVVRTNGMWQSWQDIAFSPSITARYLRLTGTFDSDDGGTNNGFHAVEWQVFGTPSALPVMYTITPAVGANGLIVPGIPVILGAGQSTSFVVSAATTNFYIASLTTNGVEVWGVAGLYTYTSWWNNVQADGAITAAFASVTSDMATNGVSVPWLRQYYTNEADLEALKRLANEDTDGDGMLTWKEYWSKTDPTDSDKFLRFTTIQGASDSTGSVVRWTSETGVVYRLTSSTNLLTDRFTTLVSTNIPATPPINVATDETAVGEAVLYYRVGVER